MAYVKILEKLGFIISIISLIKAAKKLPFNSSKSGEGIKIYFLDSLCFFMNSELETLYSPMKVGLKSNVPLLS